VRRYSLTTSAESNICVIDCQGTASGRRINICNGARDVLPLAFGNGHCPAWQKRHLKSMNLNFCLVHDHGERTDGAKRLHRHDIFREASQFQIVRTIGTEENVGRWLR